MPSTGYDCALEDEDMMRLHYRRIEPEHQIASWRGGTTVHSIPFPVYNQRRRKGLHGPSEFSKTAQQSIYPGQEAVFQFISLNPALRLITCPRHISVSTVKHEQERPRRDKVGSSGSCNLDAKRTSQ